MGERAKLPDKPINEGAVQGAAPSLFDLGFGADAWRLEAVDGGARVERRGRQAVQIERATHRQRGWEDLAIEAEALFNLPNRSMPDCVKVNRARHGRRQTVERIPAEPDGLLAPLRCEVRSRRAGRFEGMDEAQPDEALDCVEFGPPHVLDFLSHMVQVELVGQVPPGGEIAENRLWRCDQTRMSVSQRSSKG
jgi:hypothetical protein